MAELQEHEKNLRALWRKLADKGIEMGTDWPGIARVLFRDLDDAAREIADLRSRLGCVAEASYWDRPYDTRLDAIRGMCDLTTDGMTPASEKPTEVWECGPHTNVWNGHDARCRRVVIRPAVEGGA